MKIIVFILALLGGCNANFIGDKYLGAKYLSDPLGEEKLPDTDPLIRDDAFDCTTFVETVLADGDLNKLNQIRYKNGDVNFISRNHFIETDWLPNNANIVENASSEYAPTRIRRVTIDKKNWFRIVHNLDVDASKQTVDLEYIPYENIKNIDVSEPVIILFIVGNSEKRAKMLGTDLAVVHMGFLMPGGILRHASSQYGHVMDTDFYQYINARTANKNNIGIMVIKIK